MLTGSTNGLTGWLLLPTCLSGDLMHTLGRSGFVPLLGLIRPVPTKPNSWFHKLDQQLDQYLLFSLNSLLYFNGSYFNVLWLAAERLQISVAVDGALNAWICIDIKKINSFTNHSIPLLIWFNVTPQGHLSGQRTLFAHLKKTPLVNPAALEVLPQSPLRPWWST